MNIRSTNYIPYEIKKNLFLWLYYAILLLVLVSWSDYQVAPPDEYRYIYLFIFILPFFLVQDNSFLFFFTIFYTVGLYGIGFSYLPNRSMPYALVMIALVVFNQKKRIKLTGWARILLLGLLMVIVDYVDLVSISISDVLSVRRIWSVIMVCLLPAFLSSEINCDVDKLSFAFILISLVLSLQFIFLGNRVAISYDYASGIDRVAWMDPNYFAPVVGMGLIMSILSLIEKKNDALMKLLLFSTIVLSAIVIILSASRGAVLAVAVSLATIILLSKARTHSKVLMLIIGAIIMVLLYRSGIFDLLEYRFADEANLSSGSGRYEIWTRKITSFFNNSSIISLLFGVGYNTSFYLGYQEGMGFHSDFLAFLCSYGILGLILFIAILIGPLFFVKKENLAHVLSFLLFLTVVGITVEPLCNLYMPYWFLLFYIYCKAISATE